MAPKPHIIMIHGTWGRGFFPDSKIFTSNDLRWFEPGSDFHTALLAHLRAKGIDAETSHLEWSGANSFRHRDEAGKLLAQMIDAKATGRAHWPVVLIAHSHGGNVIGRAMTHTRSSLDRIYAATLATPFLEVTKTTLTTSQLRSLSMLSLCVVGIFSLLIFNGVNFWYPEQALPPATLMMLASIVILGLMLITDVLPEYIYKYASKQIELLETISSQSALASVGPRMLVVRAIDDEAALVIAGGAIGARMISLTFSIVGALRPTHLFWAAAATVGLIAAVFLPEGLQSYAVNISMGLLIVIAIVPFCVFIFVLLSAIFRATYGREMMLTGLNCEVSAHSAPDGTAASVLTLRQSDPARRLRHYIYDHPHCAATIAHWMASRLQPE